MWHKAAIAAVFISLSALCVYLYTTCHEDGIWRAGEGYPFRVSIRLHHSNITATAEVPSASQQHKSFAYVLYATKKEYLCNCLINARRLKSLGATSNADIMIIYPELWDSALTVRLERMLEILRGMQVRTSASVSAPGIIVMQGLIENVQLT